MCGSSAEWGRAQLKGASHPLSSLMDQHHLHDHLQDHAGDAGGDCTNLKTILGKSQPGAFSGFIRLYLFVVSHNT